MYDGSIKINTAVNQKGFEAGRKQIEAGLQGITTSLKKVTVAMGLAFGVGAIVEGSKQSVSAATELSNALVGLQSIMEGQGRSFSKAQQFINSYVQDGLIPATQAITAYKNLALRGYDDSQIQQVLVALKDSAAFGRQASYSLGEAVASATEGLKNENSILVDNAGVTKNVAKMWDEYAKSIGTTANNLTQQQKIQAEVTGILEESKYQVGDAAKVAGTFSGQLLQMQYRFNDLKVAIGNAILPIAQAVLPQINAMIAGFTRLANRIAQVTLSLFGRQASRQSEIAQTAQAGASALEDLASATKKADEAAKKSLASFDDLNVLQEDSKDNASAAAPNAPQEPLYNSEVLAEPEAELPLGKYYDFAKELGFLMDAVNKLKESFARLWNDTGLKESLGLIAEAAAVAGIRLLTGAIEFLAGGLDVITGLSLNLAGLLTGDMKMAAEGAAIFFSGLGQIIESVFVALIGRDAVEAVKKFVVEFAVKAWDAIKKTWSKVSEWFSTNVVQPIADFFAGLWEGVKSTFTLAWDFMTDAFKDYINGWIGLIESFINFFVKAINLLISSLNKISFDIPDWVPGIGGKSFGISIPSVPEVKIPRLATGAVIPPNAEFMAILGDQKHGRNLEAPEGLIRQIIREEMDSLGGGDITIRFEGSMAQFVRELKPHIDKETRRRGRTLIQGVTG